MLKELSPDLIQRRLTPLSPGELIENIVHERDVIQRYRRIDATTLIWTLILGFAVGGESYTIAGFQRAYVAVINQTFSCSSFYDRFTPALGQLLSGLLKSIFEEVTAPHAPTPQLQQFHSVVIVGTAVFRLHRLLSEFPMTHPSQSGTKLHLVHNLTKQTIERLKLTDERSHESS